MLTYDDLPDPGLLQRKAFIQTISITQLLSRQHRATTAQKMNFSIKGFFSKCDQIRRKLRIWSHLLKKSLMRNFIFVQCLSSPNDVHKINNNQSIRTKKFKVNTELSDPKESLSAITRSKFSRLNSWGWGSEIHWGISIIPHFHWGKLSYVIYIEEVKILNFFYRTAVLQSRILPGNFPGWMLGCWGRR